MSFCLTVRFLLSPPLFLLLLFLLHRRPLHRPHTVDAGGLLSSGILGGRSLHAGRIRRGLGEFSGERVAGGISPGHLYRVAPAPPAPVGERLGDAHHLCAAGLGPRALIATGILRLQNALPQESCPLKDHLLHLRQGVSGLKPQDIVAPTGDFCQ